VKSAKKEKRAEHVSLGNTYPRVRRNKKRGHKPRKRSNRMMGGTPD